MADLRSFGRIGRFSALAVGLSAAFLLLSAAGGEETARWYKGNTHMHSFWSDGDEFPEMAVDWYKSRGYDFLVLSDHNTVMAGERWRAVPPSVFEKCQKRFGDDWLLTRQQDGVQEVKLKTFDEVQAKLAEPGKFLLIQGEEITGSFDDRAVHVNAINLAECIAPQGGQNVVETISADVAAVEDQSKRLGRPMLAHVNHPNFSVFDITPEDLAGAAAARFFEVCNAHPGVRNLGDQTHPSVEKGWDIANTIRIAKMKLPPLWGLGSDDAHNYQEFSPHRANPGRAWIAVRAKQLSAEAILDAVGRGDFYASTGVVLQSIDYDSQKRILSVAVQPEPGVAYNIEFIGTLAGVDPAGQPVDAGEGSNPRRLGRTYSPEVGKVLASVQGASAAYQLTGQELYVRAVVRSDKPLADAPAGIGSVQQAWCQPVGWEQ